MLLFMRSHPILLGNPSRAIFKFLATFSKFSKISLPLWVIHCKKDQFTIWDFCKMLREAYYTAITREAIHTTFRRFGLCRVDASKIYFSPSPWMWTQCAISYECWWARAITGSQTADGSKQSIGRNSANWTKRFYRCNERCCFWQLRAWFPKHKWKLQDVRWQE